MEQTPDSSPATKVDINTRAIKHSRAVILIVTILVGLSLALLLVSYKTNQSHKSEVSQNKLELQQQLESQAEEIQQIKSMIDKNLQTSQQNYSQQQELIGQVQAGIRQLKRSKESSSDNWVLAQVEYLVQLAHLNLQVERDIPVAIHLLQDADSRIAELGDPELTKLRKRLQQVLVSLQSIDDPDLEGLMLRLASLSEQVDNLPLTQEQARKQLDEPESTATQASDLDQQLSRWRKGLSTTWQELKKVVVVHRYDQTISQVLPPNEQIYLREKIKLLLAQAQWAALHANPKLYQSSLNQARDMLKRYFPTHTNTVKRLRDSLKQLVQIDVKPEFPSISLVLDEVRRVLEHKL